MEPYINDWRLSVIDLKTMDARKLTNRRLKDVVEISQSMFAGSYEGLRENRKIETESFVMAATFTRTNIRREDLPEGDEINMCKAMDQLFQRFENQGIETLEHAFTFMEQAFSDGQEMVVFVTELTITPEIAVFLSEHRIERYETYKNQLLIGTKRAEILSEIARD